MSYAKIISNGKEAIIGGRDFTTDESLTMTDENVLGVSMPFRTMSQKEFDSASEDEKKGVILTNPQIGIPIAHPEIYSEEETLIGSWFEKPLYRKVYKSTMPDLSDINKRISAEELIDTNIVKITGVVYALPNAFIPMPYASFNNNAYALVIYSLDEMGIVIRTNNETLFNKPCIVVIEYTKTDEEVKQ